MQNVAVERAVAWCVLPCSGSVSEQFLACKGALDVSSHDLDGGVRSAAVAHVFGGKECFCREMGLLPRDELFAVRFLPREPVLSIITLDLLYIE